MNQSRGQRRLAIAGRLLRPPCEAKDALASIKQPAAEQAELRECVDWVEEYERFEKEMP
jgi:hypothetical protein